MSDSYKIRIKTNQFEIEVESHDKNFVLQHIEEYLLLLKSPNTKSADSRQQLPPLLTTDNGKTESTKEISLQEFLNLAQPSSGPEYVMAIGFYLEKYQGLPGFNSSQIKAEFQRAKYHHPNPSDAILKARTAGKLMDGAEKGTYVLTRTGEQWVQSRLNAHGGE